LDVSFWTTLDNTSRVLRHWRRAERFSLCQPSLNGNNGRNGSSRPSISGSEGSTSNVETVRQISTRTYIQGGYETTCTGKTNERDAREAAGRWFLDLYKQSQTTRLHGRLFLDVVDEFLKWLDETKRGELSDGQIRNYKQKWSLFKDHDDEFFVGKKLEDIDHQFLVKLRDERKKDTNKAGQPISNATIRKDLLFVRMVLGYAMEVGKYIDTLPMFPAFRGIYAVESNPTPYLTLKEYLLLLKHAKERIREHGLNPRVRRQREELLWYVMICVCAALRPGEAEGIRWSDCEKGTLKSGGETLHTVKMWVLGKHGRRSNKREPTVGLYHAVKGYDNLKAMRRDAIPNDFIFIENHRAGLTDLFKAAGLWTVQRDNREVRRTAESFRHTGISLFRLYSQNPNIDDIAEWARTSGDMVRNFYNQNPLESAVERIAAWKKPTNEDDEPSEVSTDGLRLGSKPERERLLARVREDAARELMELEPSEPRQND